MEKQNYICAQCGKKFFARRKIGRGQNIYCSPKCVSLSTQKVKNKPTTEQLKQWVIENRSYESIGREYGVTGNAVKKWIKKVSLYIPKTGPSITAECAYCGMEVKRQWNQRVNSAGKIKKKFFCDNCCLTLFKRINGKLAGVTREEVLKLLKTKSLRSIAKMYNVNHSSLKSRFSL